MESSDVIIEKLNEVFLRVHCEPSIAQELSEAFTFEVPGARFMPTYRSKVWDGKIRLFSPYKKNLYLGLLPRLLEFVYRNNYSSSLAYEFDHYSPDFDEIDEFIKKLKLPFPVREYQLDAIYNAIKYNRLVLVSPTASGKSLIIYILLRYFLEKFDTEPKSLLVVPTTSLVDQMFSDFQEYSKLEGWQPINFCHKIYAGAEKETDKKIVISTWQSIYNMQKNFFEPYKIIIGDEAHSFKAKSLIKIMENLVNCEVRLGTTGTLDGTQINQLVLEGLFGSVYKVISTKELIDKEFLAKVNIQCITLKYEYQPEFKKFSYRDEINFLISNKERNEFLRDLCVNLKGNTLLLYQLVETHGENLYKSISEKRKNSYFISGTIKTKDREKIRKRVIRNKNSIIVASYGTYSTGINIPNLNNIIFASPSKSRIRNLQSIGRGLRKTEEKSDIKVFDISDDLTSSEVNYKNYTLKHFFERIKIYNEEDFDYKLVNLKL